jgi:Bacterial lipocalin
MGGAVLGLSGSRAGITPVPIEVPRAMGTWRVLGCLHSVPDPPPADVTENLSLSHENRLHVVFAWREEGLSGPRQSKKIRGRILGDPSRGIWKLHASPLVSATHIVVGVGNDYSWAAVAHPTRRFGWILSRGPRLPEEIWMQVFSRFASLGYDTSQFVRLRHPEVPGPWEV